MVKFSSTIPFGDTNLTIEADDYVDYVEAVSKAIELASDADYLRSKIEEAGDDSRVYPSYRTDKDDNIYVGFSEQRTDGERGKNITHGSLKNKDSAIPYFPGNNHGDPGTKYYDPSGRDTGGDRRTSRARRDDDDGGDDYQARPRARRPQRAS